MNTYNNYNDHKNYNGYKASASGGYKGLAFYKQTEIIHDFTMQFCARYINYKSRTKDQMEQAARSGKQNIPEGYAQKEHRSRVRLVQVARGSLEELLVDYQDYLRQHGLLLWAKDDARAKDVRSLVYKIKDNNSNNSNDSNNSNNYSGYNFYKPYLENPEEAANVMICLINQTNAMLDKKLSWLQEHASKEDILPPYEKWLGKRMETRQQKDKEFDQQLREIMEGKRETLD